MVLYSLQDSVDALTQENFNAGIWHFSGTAAENFRFDTATKDGKLAI